MKVFPAVFLVLILGFIGVAGVSADHITAKADNTGCSDGWRITGYFTPDETDYDSDQMKEIEVARQGKVSFSARSSMTTKATAKDGARLVSAGTSATTTAAGTKPTLHSMLMIAHSSPTPSPSIILSYRREAQ